MPPDFFSRNRRVNAASRDLYDCIVRQARRPGFYSDLGVPDTVDGRFELICLHAFLVMRRLRALDAAPLSQALFDTMFDDMDRSLREMGAGDLGVGRRVKAMAKAYYGRIAAYEQGLAEGSEALAAALARNVYRATAESPAGAVESLAGYVIRENAALGACDAATLLSGSVRFGAPPSAQGADRTEAAR